jgi:hypothetical protein
MKTYITSKNIIKTSCQNITTSSNNIATGSVNRLRKRNKTQK